MGYTATPKKQSGGGWGDLAIQSLTNMIVGAGTQALAGLVTGGPGGAAAGALSGAASGGVQGAIAAGNKAGLLGQDSGYSGNPTIDYSTVPGSDNMSNRLTRMALPARAGGPGVPTTLGRNVSTTMGSMSAPSAGRPQVPWGGASQLGSSTPFSTNGVLRTQPLPNVPSQMPTAQPGIQGWQGTVPVGIAGNSTSRWGW